MTTATALAATITGTLLTLAPIPPQAIRDAHRTITPDMPFEQDPDVTAALATIDRITAWLPRWQQAGSQALDRNLAHHSHAEDQLLAAYGYQVPTDEQRYQTRQAARTADDAIHAAADRAHPAADCPACRGWLDCPAADRALRDAIHEDWVNRWAV